MLQSRAVSRKPLVAPSFLFQVIGQATFILYFSLILLALFVVSCGGQRQEEASDAAVAELSFPGAPVILISIDTLRSDHLPVYGYRGVETPNIDGLRGESVLFLRAYSHSPLTLPSHVSIFTGVLPANHGVRNNLGFTFDSAQHATIPSLLEAHGYTTGAAVSAYVLRAATGLGAAFNFYDDAISLRGLASTGSMQRSGAVTAEVAQRWIGEHAERPFCFFLHLFEPHSPYEPPEPFRNRYPLAYDGEIAAADAIVGDFVEFLKRVGVFDRSIIVLLSDHGEGLDDHGEEEHGIFLYREAIQVPLIIKLPGGRLAGSTVDRPAQLIDLLPTLAGLTGFTTPPDLAGRSLFGGPDDERGPPDIVSETMYPRIHFGWSEVWSLIDGRYHLLSAPGSELYDLIDDPEEQHDLIESLPGEGARLSALLGSHKRDMEGTLRIDGEEAERLRALGYIGAPAALSDGPLPNPKDRIESLRLLGAATHLAAVGRIDEAVTQLRAMLEVNPGFTDGWLQLAQVCQRGGRLEEAITAYEKTINVAPMFAADASASLATIYLQLNRIDEAEGWARRSIDSGAASGHLLLGRILLARRDASAAETEARVAMDDSLFRFAGAVLLAEALVAQDRLEEALQVVVAVIDDLQLARLDPVERLHMVHGDILGRLERYDEAETAFLAEIDSFPSNQLAYTNLAVVYYVQGKVEPARSTLERMVQANPHPISLLLAARTSRQLGDSEAAAVWQQRIDAQR